MSKIIKVSNRVYEELTRMKGSASYSEVIIKLLENNSDKSEVLRRFGVGDVDEKRMALLKKGWKKWSDKYV